MNKPESVSAEVMLCDLPESELEIAREKAAKILSQSGIHIVAQGGRSISVECTPQQFENVFKCSVIKRRQASSPGIDFGQVSGEAFTTNEDPSIPEQLTQEVESIHIQIPPSMF